jgi:ApbE superfamily uncharacterized protein (UPF0280 family)
MQGYKVQFNVFANSQEEADAASRAIATFVDNMAKQGVAVTAEKLSQAVQSWGNNPLVRNYFKK